MFKVLFLMLLFTMPVSTAIYGLDTKTEMAFMLAEGYYGSPIFVTSAYRTKEQNKEVGGVPNSQHLYGKAVDIRLPKNQALLNKLIWALSQAGFTSIGLYPTHVHADVRSNPVFWFK